MSRALTMINLSLFVLFPIAWFAPLARAGILPFFTGSELSIIGGVRDLWATDPGLAVLVAIFAVVAPYLKTTVLSAIHLRLLGGERWIKALELMGKLSMADVFLLSLYIVIVKGVGIGHVETAWGLWLFTFCVLASLAVSLLTGRRREGAI